MIRIYRYSLAFVMLFLSMLLLAGCASFAGGETSSKEAVTLWAVTEKSREAGMNQQTQTLIERFESEHEGVTVELEILPEYGEEREARLERLRIEIMAGQGPDIYLLPGGSSLFADPVQAMYNDIFADISEYYDADSSLGKEGLAASVMDAGMVGDSRYILPFRYDIPVVYADMGRLREAGLSEEAFAAGMSGLLEAVQQSGASELFQTCNLAMYQYDFLLNFFSEMINYEKQELQITKETARDYFQLLAGFTGELNPRQGIINPILSNYLIYNQPWLQEYGLYFGSLEDILSIVSMEKLTGSELSEFPLTSADGSLTAKITYYGAVGSNCEESGQAYEFLRLFLLEESQWEQNRKVSTTMGEGYLLADGWPVRSQGAAAWLWKKFWEMGSDIEYPETEDLIAASVTGIEDGTADGQNGESSASRKKRAGELSITDADISILKTPVEKARFSIYEEYVYAAKLIELMLTGGEVGVASENDADVLAEELVRELQKRVAEG